MPERRPPSSTWRCAEEVPATGNFGELSFRNCLEIRDGSRMGAQRAAKRARRGLDSGASCRHRGALRRLRPFSKQFRKGNSQKFAGTEFSEVRSAPVRCGRYSGGHTEARVAEDVREVNRRDILLMIMQPLGNGASGPSPALAAAEAQSPTSSSFARPPAFAVRCRKSASSSSSASPYPAQILSIEAFIPE